MKQSIDFVITWVDETDPEWSREREYYAGESDSVLNGTQCFRSWDTLRYWFRGVESFAPWVRKIFFVTAGHVPSWLDTEHPKLEVVRHEDFIPEEYLPTFSSIAIEWNLHRIPGLSEQFVYFNDDMFLLQKTCPTDFFRHGLPRDTAGMALCVNRYGVGREELDNTRVLQEHFQKNTVLRQHWTKWFRPSYRDVFLRTLLLLPWSQFPGFYEPHGSVAYRKNSFEAVCALAPEEVEHACQQKLRDGDSVNHWLVRDWQLVTGNFSPRRVSFQKAYYDYSDDVVKAILHRRHPVVCVNDSPNLTEEDFLLAKSEITAAFASILPTPSAFEKTEQ